MCDCALQKGLHHLGVPMNCAPCPLEGIDTYQLIEGGQRTPFYMVYKRMRFNLHVNLNDMNHRAKLSGAKSKRVKKRERGGEIACVCPNVYAHVFCMPAQHL